MTADTSWAFRRAVSDLVPLLRERADLAERQRRLPAETIADLRDCGLLRAFVPRAYGGDERTLAEVLDAIVEVGVGCASTAWVGALLAIHNIAVCWLEKGGQDEIFADGPDVVLSSSVAPTGALTSAAGGFRLAGKWGFSSGVDHASWIMLGATLKAEAAPGEYFLCFVRASEVLLIDDWHVCGLRGSGSKSVELREVFVPNRRALLLRTVREGSAPGLALHASPFYRLPWESLFISAFAPAALGTAMAMLEGFREYTAARLNRFTGRGFRTNAGSALRAALAAAEIDAARLVFRRDVAALDRAARKGSPLLPGTAERISYDVPFVIDSCGRAVRRLYRGSGGRILYENNPLQRHFRDVHAMTQHAVLDMDGAGEIYGRALLQNPSFRVGARE